MIDYLIYNEKGKFIDFDKDVVKTISLSDFRQYSDHVAMVIQAYDKLTPFRLLNLKIAEAIAVIESKNIERGNRVEMTFQEARVFSDKINSLILEILTLFRSFIDQSTRILDDAGREHFKRAQAELFDCNFSYRFFSKLRNYTQHFSLPIGAMKMNTNKFNGNTLIIPFDTNSLLKFDGWGPIVKAELGKINGAFDVLPVIFDFHIVIRKLGQAMCKILNIDLLLSETALNKLIPLKCPMGSDMNIVSMKSKPPRARMEGVLVPFFMIEELKSLTSQDLL